MGPNQSDVASMVLLPELAYRHAFDRELFRPPTAWMHAGSTGPILGETEPWHRAVLRHLPASPRERGGRRLIPAVLSGVARRAARRVAELTGSRPLTGKVSSDGGSHLQLALDWMPAMRYQPYWSRMPFFALPSFYDGRVRVNLKGRERKGRVTIGQYPALCDEIEDLLRACRDPVTGEDAVDFVERTGGPDPYALGPSESDLVVVWKGTHCALEHPTLGRVGPAPFRRPGGHTGRYGVAYVRAPGIVPGDCGVRSSFDVVPTLFALAGQPTPAGLTGRSLLTPLSPDAMVRS
jgi:hypothetical protein